MRSKRNKRKLINKKEKVMLSIILCIAVGLAILQPGSKNEASTVSAFTQPIKNMYSFMGQQKFQLHDEMSGSIYHSYRSLKKSSKKATSNELNEENKGNQEQSNSEQEENHKDVKTENENTIQDDVENVENVKKTEVEPEKSEPDLNRKKIYLTFDDGPTVYTTSILETLKSYNMLATFFMLEPNMKKYPEELNALLKDGHVPALHGVTHDVSKIYRSEKTVVDEMNQAQSTLISLTGAVSTLIRTPYGSSPYMKPSYKEAVKNAGYQLWDWTVDSQDWKYKNGEYVYRVIEQMENFKYENRPIVILLHDRKSTAQHLSSLLNYLQENGYETELLNETLSAYHF